MSTLFLVPSDIAQGDTALAFGSINTSIHLSIDIWIVEKLKTARQYLRRTDKTYPIDNKTFIEIPKHGDDLSEIYAILNKAHNQNLNLGLISEAGYPAVADPGTPIVLQAHRLGIQVQPLIGPNSLIMALSASGLNGERFMYQSYFPLKGKDKEMKIKEVKQLLNLHITQIFIETPYRNKPFLEFLCQTFSPHLYLSIAQNLGDTNSKIRTLPLKHWSKHTEPFFSPDHKSPAVFILASSK